MVHTVASDQPSVNSISLTRAYVDRPQRVSVTMNGLEYPGEVVFADQWQPWFGAALPERVMFRLVLLSTHQRVDRSDIVDRHIAVAIPPVEDSNFQPNEFAQLNREIGRLNEIREQYVASTDSGLNQLASSLTSRTHEAQRNIAGVLADRWRRGDLVTADENHGRITGDSIFIDDEPGAWVEAIAATMFTNSASAENVRYEDDRISPEALFDSIVATDESPWRTELDNRVQRASGIGLSALLESLNTVAEEQSGRIEGDALRTRLLRQHGLPSGLASLFIAALIKLNNGEAEIVANDRSVGNRIDSHTLGSTEYDPEFIYAINWLSNRQADDWNSALTYVRALLPHATPTEDGEPGSQLERQFTQALQVAGTRTTLTIRTLSEVAGPAIDSLPAVHLARRLAPVLESSNWKEFYSSAIDEFPNASEFAEAVSESSRLRALCEDVVDVQAAYEYVESADFGRIDQELATDAQTLLAMLSVNDILLNHRSAGAVLHNFQQWRLRFTGAYSEHHAERRAANLELSRRIKKSDLLHQAVRKLVAVPELHGIYNEGFAAGWIELQERVEPCPNREHELALQTHPYCDTCGVRMGSAGHEDEVEERIAEIEDMHRRCSTRLGEIAVSRVLTGKREEELRKLIQINSIADLTSISHVLNDGVMRFLERFATDTPDPSDEQGKAG